MRLSIDSPAVDSRIALFLLTPDQVTPRYVSWLNDREVNQYLECRAYVHTMESTRTFVATLLASPDDLFLGIRLNADSEHRHVGNIRLGMIDWQRCVGEIGIMIGDREVWGRGVASAAIEAVAELAHTRLSLRRLAAGCYGSNEGSRRAFEKAGFFIEAVRREQSLVNGRVEDVVRLAREL